MNVYFINNYSYIDYLLGRPKLTYTRLCCQITRVTDL